jgi:hypothetical protein
VNAPTRGTWEYRIVTEIGQDELDGLGREEWELVAVLDRDDGATFYLKRPTLSFREQVTLDQKRRYYAQWGRTIPEDGGDSAR